ncbi:hypothetical protein [Shimazuella soli]|nr:hypothetical protein [Shimazuella soli]
MSVSDHSKVLAVVNKTSPILFIEKDKENSLEQQKEKQDEDII